MRGERIAQEARELRDVRGERGVGKRRGDVGRDRRFEREVPDRRGEIVDGFLRTVTGDATDRVVELTSALEFARVDFA
jgi:hypothetical protein